MTTAESPSPSPDDLTPLPPGRRVEIEREPESIQFADYLENPTDKRQLFWLGHTSRAVSVHTSPGARLLDIGSSIHWLTGVAAGREVQMVDVRPHPLAHILPFPLHTANATELPFEPETFDVVTFPQLLHWVGTGTYGDPVNINGDLETLTEVARVLKTGGVGIFTTFVVPGQTVLKLGGRRLFGLNDLRDILTRAGLEVIDLSLRDSNCDPIEPEAVPERSHRVLTPGNPDEDLAWAIYTVRKKPC